MEPNIFLGNTGAKHEDVIGVDRDDDASIVKCPDWMVRDAIDPAKHDVGRGTDVKPNFMVREEAHDRGRFRSCYPMLHFIEPQFFDRLPNVVRGAPFSYMSLEPQAIREGCTIDLNTPIG